MKPVWACLLLTVYFFGPIQTLEKNICSERRVITYINNVRKSRIVPYAARNFLGFWKTKYRHEWYIDPMVSFAS